VFFRIQLLHIPFRSNNKSTSESTFPETDSEILIDEGRRCARKHVISHCDNSRFEVDVQNASGCCQCSAMLDVVVLARQGSATSFSHAAHSWLRIRPPTPGKRIFNRQPLTHSSPQDEVHVRLSMRTTSRSPPSTNYSLENTHHTHPNSACPHRNISRFGRTWADIGNSHSEELLEIPEGVKVSIKTRNVVVEGEWTVAQRIQD
jgi:hypothetical protein